MDFKLSDTPVQVPYRVPGGQSTQWMDIYSRLAVERIIFLEDSDYDYYAIKANEIVAQMLYLDSVDPGKDIYLYINNASGGRIRSGLMIYDTIQHIKSDVVTICVGSAVFMGSFLLAAGTKGKRMALPHSRIMIHQPSGGTRGQATDIEIEAREILRIRHQLNGIYADKTGQTIAKIEKDMDRDFFMSAAEAKDYGLIDRVIEERP
ncbi:MAG: ATP-dependent Clp protease proteolytic subunit [Gloeotrichia echinulata GP01]